MESKIFLIPFPSESLHRAPTHRRVAPVFASRFGLNESGRCGGRQARENAEEEILKSTVSPDVMQFIGRTRTQQRTVETESGHERFIYR